MNYNINISLDFNELIAQLGSGCKWLSDELKTFLTNRKDRNITDIELREKIKNIPNNQMTPDEIINQLVIHKIIISTDPQSTATIKTQGNVRIQGHGDSSITNNKCMQQISSGNGGGFSIETFDGGSFRMEIGNGDSGVVFSMGTLEDIEFKKLNKK